ncbi:LysE family translocator [Jannaschia donghaensis]|uniref:Threonine efflux protein n=1 Tax=Jannaschia donghaensis TaxID=420998 RepID=A0A0M6YJF8_9RHOB|nr:LysE family transporter [Jannaschia donghaensis]CTQ50054.1 Threonine efflux protein [Jannaschia donghaensis]
MIEILAAFALVTFAPGPANLAVGLVAMAHGPRPSLRMAVGLASGLAIWGGIAALGLGTLLAGSEAALTVLRVFGGAYLLWLGWKAARTAWSPAVGAARVSALAKPFRTGLLLNLSNPKAVLAWMAALAMGLGPETGGGFVALATGLCALIGLANYLCWSLLLSRGPVRRGYARSARWIDGIAAGMFAVAGVGLIRQGLAR